MLKKTLAVAAQTIAKYFPNTKIIPTLGNNDGKYHYDGLSLEDRDEYYSFYYDHWFTQMPGNKDMASQTEIINTFKTGGYYRVDIDSKLSVLALNTLYFNKKNDETGQGTIAAD